MEEKLSIEGRVIGPGEPPYIIAEIGANHNGDMELCRKLIDEAKRCGTDAVKFQSWSKSSLFARSFYKANEGLEKEVEKYQLSPEQHREVAAYCRETGITFFSSCFSTEEIDFLESLEVPAYKIASMDVNHLALLEHVAGKKRPVILSTGMATLGEIDRALDTLRRRGSGPVAILHCIVIYPPEYDIINLRNIAMLRETFGVPTGFSDHSIGTAIPLAAIALGACIIEKHFTLDKKMEGWDHAVSADPAELEVIVKEGRNIFTALGSPVRTVSEAEMEKRKVFRRSIVANRALKKGERITADVVEFKRPGTGISPDELKYVLGRELSSDLKEDDFILWDQLK